MKPSFGAPWALTLRPGGRGAFSLRVTRLSRDVWAAMMKRMSELQGLTVNLSAHHQRRALADVSVQVATAERHIDPATANLLSMLWRALIARSQVVETEVVTVDGTGYSIMVGGRTGSTQSPVYGSILERTTYAAERLAHFVESPEADDESDLVFVREELKEALARTRAQEPCVRMVK
ncbi:MAG TPA: hypothetical protein VFQ61_01435 [Polyangiaceae bacterium]|nr:hypothetical protein [Polyangiaceae bacterium]